MTDEKKKEFTLRITQCSRTELVAITDEIILTYLEEAKGCDLNRDSENFYFCLKKSNQFLDDLISALDMRFSLSGQLLSLYLYMKKEILQAGIRREKETLDTVMQMLEKLKESFHEAAKSDKGGSIMENSGKVYAGFTYGKNKNLNEIVL